MISGLSMHCVDAPRMTFKTADGNVWIDLGSGKPSQLHTESRIAIHVWERSPEVVQRAVDAFNAAMGGATLLPVYPSRDAEHAASSAGHLAAEIEGRDPLRLANREKHREAAQAGDEVRAREDVGALS